MNEFLQRLKQRKIVQWAIAYVAFAFALLQGLDIIAERFAWPGAVERHLILALAVGFCVALVLAWYHGERGAQHVGSMEIMILALLLAIGGTLIWRFGPSASNRARAQSAPVGTVAASTPAASVAAQAASAIAAQPMPAKSIAVLPFENLSDEKANAYFASGMQDMILTKLADIGDLKVIARTSTEKYASHPDDLKTIARQLGVATILEGSVQKARNQVLINVQLIDASTDAHLWAQAYTRTLDNIFGVEGEVAQKVAEALDAKLTSAETSRLNTAPTQNPQAYDLFLQGEFYLSRAESGLRKADFDTAVQKYQAAIKQDPQFALAWARLAYTQMAQLVFIGDDGSNLAAQAKVAVDRALALAPNLAEAHLEEGDYRYSVLHDLDGALDAFNTALVVKPHYADAIFFIGVIHFHLGQWGTAIEALQHAVTLDPRNVRNMQEMAVVYMFLRRYAEADQVLKEIIAIDPSHALAAISLARTYLLHTGDLGRAMAILDAAPASTQDNPYTVLLRSQIMLFRHDYVDARRFAAGLKPGYVISAGDIETQLGDIEWAAGNRAAAREHYLRAATLMKATLKQNPNGVDQPSDLGWIYARLGREREALAQGQLGIKLHPVDQDVWSGIHALVVMAQIQAQVGHVGDAVDRLDRLLAMPAGFEISVPLLKLDPAWDPIRNDPRFQVLLKQYAKFKPAITSDTAPAATPAPAMAASVSTP